MSPAPSPIVVIGAGPAGLMAADVLSAAGRAVEVFDRMPSVGRKFLMAGRGGLNLTHSEPLSDIMARYGGAADRLAPAIEAFPPAALRAWAEDLGQETFVGSSGRVFPRALKASPLLRAWIARLTARGVAFHTRHEWRGWTPAGALAFATPEGDRQVQAAAAVLALGGASWARLGSDGAWAPRLAESGVDLAPFAPANCGFEVDWTPAFRERFAGTPLKAVAIGHGGRSVRGEAMITRSGLEGGTIYALGPSLRAATPVEIRIDLRPGMTVANLTARLARVRPRESLSNRLRKALSLTPAEINLLREGHGLALALQPAGLAAQVKAIPIVLRAPCPLDRAISTAGGIGFDALNADLMLKVRPGVFAAGEMLDWEAPTGGYLLQACFATGAAAARGVLRWTG